jgi:O-phosphoseryl-tRNA synthetase
MYSPSALAEYGIGIPVMNLGLGVERLAMIAYNANDVRQLCYPQFFPRILTNRDIAGAVRLREEPVSPEGKMLTEAIIRVATVHGTAPGPCSFDAWEGTLGGIPVKVSVEEPESNAKLCGPACANEIFVHDGSILGIPDAEKWKQVRTEGISTGITYLSAVAALAAARIEESARCKKSTVVQVKMAKLPSDINLIIDEFAMRAVTDNNKKVDVRGPVFLSVRSIVQE